MAKRNGSGGRLARLRSDTRASVYAIMAASILPVMGLMGGAIDFGRAYLVNSKLQSAVDSAAIAGVRAQQVNSATGEESDTWRKVDQYLTANFPATYMGYTSGVRDIDVSRQDTSIKVDLDVTGSIPTTFLRVLGIDTLPVGAKATAEAGERLNAIEAMLVLDNTGSMASNGGMVAMKAAATDFVNIVYSNQETVDDVAIGMLPYNIVVNVGRLLYDSHRDMIDDYGENRWRQFYRNDPSGPMSWKGCVFADPTSTSLSSNTNILDDNVFDIGKTMPGERTAGGSVTMPAIRPYIYPSVQVASFDSVNNRYRLQQNFNREERMINSAPHLRHAYWDRYGNDICKPGQSGRDCEVEVSAISDISSWPDAKSYGHKSDQSLTGPSPNYECPSEALPVEYDRTRSELIDYINNENYALPNIGTIHTPAMTWAYRLLARDDIFTRDTPTRRPVKRVLIFLTDGNFDSNDKGRKNAAGPTVFDTAYTAYGTYADKLVTTSTAQSSFLNAMPRRFEKTCQAAKKDGIEIFTITFALSSTATGDMFKRCSSDANTHYFAAKNPDALRAAFRSIAADLVDLHLSR